MKNNDVVLIQRILTGDETAFESLIRKYRKQIHAHAWRKTGDFHIAEDITQDTFLQVYQKLDTLDDPTQFSGWLYVIVNRLCIAWFRKNRIRTESLEETDISEIETEAYSQYVAAENAKTNAEAQRDLVQKLLTKLKESDRQIITLHYFQEMTYSEIGSYLGISESSIKSRLHRARQRLKKYEFIIQEALDITFKEEHRFHKDSIGGFGMKLTIERDDLLSSLQMLQGVASDQDTVPILSNVLIHAEGNLIECMATDMEIGIKLKVEGTVRQEGTIVVSSKKLGDIVKEWSVGKPIYLSTTADDQVEITGGNGVSKTVKLSTEEFPQLPSIDEEAFAIDGETLRRVLRKTKFAVPTEKARHSLKGLYFNLLKDRTEVVATDGSKLALAYCESIKLAESSDGFIVPLKAVKEIGRTFANSPQIKIARIENQILFADEHATLTTKLINGEYPPYEIIVANSPERRAVVQREPILSVIRRLSLLSNPKCPSVYLEIDEQQIRISPKLSAQDEECETLAVESSTGKVHIRISSQFLIDALEHIETESFALEFSSTMRPVIVKPIGEVGHICIIMPMRLEDLDRHFNNT
jgi:DNA polymerase III beta subunit